MEKHTAGDGGVRAVKIYCDKPVSKIKYTDYHHTVRFPEGYRDTFYLELGVLN